MVSLRNEKSYPELSSNILCYLELWFACHLSQCHVSCNIASHYKSMLIFTNKRYKKRLCISILRLCTNCSVNTQFAIFLFYKHIFSYHSISSEPVTFVQRLPNVFQTPWTFGTRLVVVVQTSRLYDGPNGSFSISILLHNSEF